MKLKTCIVLTVLVTIVTVGVMSLFNFFYSPITGLVTVNALNGGVAEYGMARFVQNGHFGVMIQLVAAGLLAWIWIPFIFRGIK